MTPEESTRLVELAGMKCPAETALRAEYPIVDKAVGAGAMVHPTECICHGSGYLLQGVRVPCCYCRGTCYTHEPFAGRGQGGQNDPSAKYLCEGCAGRGWTAPEDYFVLEQALVKINLQVNRFAPGPTLVIGTVNGSRAIPDMSEAVLTALARR